MAKFARRCTHMAQGVTHITYCGCCGQPISILVMPGRKTKKNKNPKPSRLL